jgi:hypothetical protein
MDMAGVGAASTILTISEGGSWYFKASWAPVLNEINTSPEKRSNVFRIMIIEF